MLIISLVILKAERLVQIQSEAIHIILGCVKDMSSMAMRLLDLPTIEQRISMGRHKLILKLQVIPTYCTQTYTE